MAIISTENFMVHCDPCMASGWKEIYSPKLVKFHTLNFDNISSCKGNHCQNVHWQNAPVFLC